MKILAVLCFATVTASCCEGQPVPLRSASYGLAVMLDDIPKERIIDEIRFLDGKDNTVDVVRFDIVGPGAERPLIFSSEIAIPTDSMGIFSFRLPADTLTNLLSFVHHANPQFHSRNRDFILIRVTYRYQNQVNQYYVTNARIASGYLRIIEKKLINNKDDSALKGFYIFIGNTGLRKWENGKLIWVMRD